MSPVATADRTRAVVASFAVTDLNGTIAALNARVAGLTAELAAANAGRAADKVASDKALADAKAASDSATVTAKVAADIALATAKAEHKAKFNALAKKWNAKNPKAKVALIK